MAGPLEQGSTVYELHLVVLPFFMKLLGKKSKNVFQFFEFRLGINFFHFRLGRFEKVEERLGSPKAEVEIGTG